jgi:hypothetical protein
MQFGLKLSVAAVIVSVALTGSASAQISDQTAGQGTASTGNANPSANGATADGNANMTDKAPPGTVNEGTLAESAATTALATSTYHQPTGFLPGMKS